MKCNKSIPLSKAVVVSILGTTVAPAPALAASQNECAIWICLPGGFPSGCGDAKRAFKKRLKKGQSPLPPFSRCAVNDGSGSNMSYDHDYAALVQEQRVCKRLRSRGRDEERCVEWETIPAHTLKGTPCHRDRDGYTYPRGCVATYRYVDVFIDGQPAGDTYFWR